MITVIKKKIFKLPEFFSLRVNGIFKDIFYALFPLLSISTTASMVLGSLGGQ